MKKRIEILSKTAAHWVGDGFHVQSVISYPRYGDRISPFLLLDYAAPREFAPTTKYRGVGQHPHRGFETVTIAYQGKVEHRDSLGNHGVIAPGDVQWMTAGSGILHEEWHEQEFAKSGGVFEVIQLWINLPAKHKMTRPKYQELVAASIPKIQLNSNLSMRVIAGNYQGVSGPANTFSPVHLWELSGTSQGRLQIDLHPAYSTLIFLRSGRAVISMGYIESRGETPRNHLQHNLLNDPAKESSGDEETVIRSGELAILPTYFVEPTFISPIIPLHLQLLEPCELLILHAEPLNEPIVGNGPFVMNTMQEIEQAYQDYAEGKLGGR